MTDNDRTTINVSKDAHRTAKAAKRDGESWTEYLLRCTDAHPREDTARVVVEEIRDELGIEGDADIPTVVKNSTGQADSLDYDDVKNACAAAIREELEEGMGR